MKKKGSSEEKSRGGGQTKKRMWGNKSREKLSSWTPTYLPISEREVDGESIFWGGTGREGKKKRPARSKRKEQEFKSKGSARPWKLSARGKCGPRKKASKKGRILCKPFGRGRKMNQGMNRTAESNVKAKWGLPVGGEEADPPKSTTPTGIGDYTKNLGGQEGKGQPNVDQYCGRASPETFERKKPHVRKQDDRRYRPERRERSKRERWL